MSKYMKQVGAKYDLLFVATFINLRCIDRLLNSLVFNHCVNLRVVLIAQNNLQLDVEQYQSEFTQIDVVGIESQLSLSSARNVGVDYVVHKKIEAKYVMFPDDDSSFDISFFNNFADHTKEGLPLVIDVLNEGSQDKYIRHSLKCGAKLSHKHYYAVGSTNMIIPYELFLKVGKFDEEMGIGAQYGSAEDVDYFIRAVKQSSFFVYNSVLYNFHPKAENKYKELSYEQILSRYKNYGIGAAYLFSKHKLYDSSLGLCLRALGALIINLVKFDFKMARIYFMAFIYRVRAVTKFALRKI